ncbi:molybdate ABC transporter substrate-binding protein [Candidatus Uabimicrobium amorphum]|uniref:Molybdate ABC transporter substrate-binding protein n=1 Tax=Uabimicrobium amorphum TaxID=2596890 RepID=A0A5S9F647_UABAM|nr:molybdate ABC transporter substrate-binding protein [Candidatus Uabimicrobium amorphum]BBM87302.1 molybdate ABC transporter substrate-binding protein [Candidatus Uabimicrobium amorphum]
MCRRPFYLLVTLMVILGCNSQNTPQITIACAANFFPTLRKISRDFAQHHQVKVNNVMGASGNLYAQIESGAPYDIFFSADCHYPQKINNNSNVPVAYVTGKLVLWTNMDLEVHQGISLLTTKKIQTIAIANPQYAPYGQKSKEMLMFYKVWDKIHSKLVFGKNVGQTFQFAQTGNADIAIVPLSLAKKSGQYWQIPPRSYTPITQCYIVLNNNALSKKFLSFFHKSHHTIKKDGYDIPK